MPATEELDGPPDTRGTTAPLPLTLFVLGIASLILVLGGLIAVQTIYHLNDRDVTPACRDELTIQLPDEDPKLITGGRGVCNVVEGLTSSLQTGLLYAGIAAGGIALIGGWRTYKHMPNKRRRGHAVAGAVLGVQAIGLALMLLWFRSGNLFTFGRNFFNISVLEGSMDGFIRGAKNTLFLAFAGELGGVVIGLFLAVLTMSDRKVVRAPARTYVNFFRGTPLIWQLSFFFFMFTLGLDLGINAFQAAIIVFSLNTGAYAAEVFRAGIQSIERGQSEAARSLGMSYLQSMQYVVVPQAVRRVIPPLMNEFVILIKDTSLITVLGLTVNELDIYSFSRQAFSDSRNATFFVATAVAYLVVTLPLIRLVNYVESRMRSGLTGVQL